MAQGTAAGPAPVADRGPAVLVLRAAGRACAVDLARVTRVVEDVALAELPDAPDVVLGLANVGSRVVGVLDLGLLLGGAPAAAARVVAVVVTQHGPVGLALDERPAAASRDALADGVAVVDVDVLLAPERLR